jgi:hypothetical protein
MGEECRARPCIKGWLVVFRPVVYHWKFWFGSLDLQYEYSVVAKALVFNVEFGVDCGG